jgi:CheY-like chemotaxis protein
MRRRVLLVEDDFLIAALIGDMLAELGHELGETADRLDDAMALAQSGAFDLGLLDLTLRGATTYRVADLLSARAIPFAFVTGHGAGEIDTAYAHHPVLHKPFRRHDLAAVIARLLPGAA